MEKLNIPETYRKPTRQQPTIPIYEQDPWEDDPYRPNPECSACKGAGFLHPCYGEAVIYRKMVPCKAPGCLLDSIRGTGPERQTFDTFVTVPGTEQALKTAKALAYGKGGFAWLLIYGHTGCGKTHLANAIAHVTRERGFECKVVLAADLLAMLRDAIKDHQADAILARFKAMPFLIIDDYGVEYGTDWESSQFDQLITSRYATAKPTVLVTNKDISDLPDRVRSRFQDKDMSRAVHNAGADYRARR